MVHIPVSIEVDDGREGVVGGVTNDIIDDIAELSMGLAEVLKLESKHRQRCNDSTLKKNRCASQIL